MNKRIKMMAGAGLAALALVVAGGGYYYFHVHSDKPDLAIKAITQSIEQHDLQEFHRAVNVDSVINSGYDGFVDGLTALDRVTTPEALDAIKNFTQMLRGPMTTSLRAAIDSYVATGELNTAQNVGVNEMLERVGLNGIEMRRVENVELNDANHDEAFANVVVFQPELGNEFTLQIVLARGENHQWQVVRLLNFKDYVEQIIHVRRSQLDEYLTKAGEINVRHDSVIRDAEKRYGIILSAGNLSDDKTRAELKKIIDDIFLKDWEERKQELFSLHVPKDAETLNNLYLRICDTWIDAAKEYSKWMDDKNSMTIKSAEGKIHQAQTLSTEAAAIAKRMTTVQP